jgi:hypothetical protein
MKELTIDKEIFNPMFFDIWDFFDSDKRFASIYGGSGCFGEDTLLTTDKGLKRISEVEVGDIVKSFNHNSDKSEFMKVKNTFKYEDIDKQLILIKLKGGAVLKVTEGHKFWFKGEYVPIKEILKIKEKEDGVEKN